MLKLKLRILSPDRAELRIKIWERIFFLLLSLFFFILSLGGEGTSIVGLVFAFLTLAAGLHVDYWLFDKQEKRVQYSFGFFPFVKKRVFPFSDLSSFHLRYSLKMPNGEAGETVLAKANQVLPSFLQKGYVSLLLNTREKRYTIQTLHFSKTGEIEKTASEISSLCNIPLTHE